MIWFMILDAMYIRIMEKDSEVKRRDETFSS